METTICAIATPAGSGGIAIIRVSGSRAYEICNGIFRPAEKNIASLTDMPSHTIHFGQIMADSNTMIDEVLLSIFRAPHSFTGEDVVEINCHGSVFIQQEILKLLVQNGCTMAQPGEFTKRAFANGRMDLSQAEAVADLIAAQSKAAHRIALHQMRGGFSSELSLLRDQLLHLNTLVELELDFSEEDVAFADRAKLMELTTTIRTHIEQLERSFATGNAIKQGIPVAIVGETNAGKSTLLNLLLHEERAIVSDVHGTTRDTIEDTVNINGVLFRFIDTAGLRQTDNAIENIGIKRTYEMIEKADIILWTIDCTQVSEHIDWLAEHILSHAIGKKTLLVFNKTDKINDEEREALDALFAPYRAERLYISAKQRIHTDQLEQRIYAAAQLPDIADNETIVANIRHHEALLHARTAIERVQNGLKEQLSGDLLAEDIRACLHYLGEITGQITTEDTLNNIFKNFCIGK